MNKLKKIEGNLDIVANDKQCHWNGEHYVDIPKDALLSAWAFIEIDSDTDTPQTIRYCIYRNYKKGLYVKVRGKRVYLNDLGHKELKQDD